MIENAMLSNQVYDVLIVGAGPVGLATAIALRQRGINNILVVERARSFRQVGQVIDILPNGLKALKYIDRQAYDRVKQTGLEFVTLASNNNPQDKNPQKRAWNHKNLQGKKIRSIPLDFEYWLNRYGEGRVSLSWYSLQTTLRNLLPPEIVRVNHRCIDVAKGNGYLEITCVSDREIANNPFAHWERQTSRQGKSNSIKELETDRPNSKNLRAKLVVAADGINSTVRQVLYANSDLSQWAKPRYSGVAAIGCLQIDHIPDEILQELAAKCFQGDRVITLLDNSMTSDAQNLQRPRIILIHRPGNTCGYLLNTPLSLDTLQNKSSEEVINLAVNVLEKANFPASVIKLVRLSTSEGLFHRPYYIHRADIPISNKPIWSNGRVVLVGDAAHGMPPFAAQGANQGFEDGALIATLIANIIHHNTLDDEKIIANEFIKYEQIRRPFMSKIQTATMENHNWSQAEWDEYGNMVYGRDIRQLISKEINY